MNNFPEYKSTDFNGERSPCFGCTERTEGCHGLCAAYAAWSERRRDINRARKLAMFKNSIEAKSVARGRDDRKRGHR